MRVNCDGDLIDAEDFDFRARAEARYEPEDEPEEETSPYSCGPGCCLSHGDDQWHA